MQVEISSGPAFAFGEITLPAGGAVRVESGFTGPGRLWLRTRSSSDPIGWIQSKPPPASRS